MMPTIRARFTPVTLLAAFRPIAALEVIEGDAACVPQPTRLTVRAAKAAKAAVRLKFTGVSSTTRWVRTRAL
ncbi:hypothetical protein D3C72_2411440 [compost metagenome]